MDWSRFRSRIYPPIVYFHRVLDPLMSPLIFCQTKTFTLVLVCVAALAIHPATAQTNPASAEVDFNRDIRPILSDRCFKCHGPDENSRATDLRLDIRDSAKEILEKRPDESLQDVAILQRINSRDEDEVMPPPSSKMSLTAAEKELLQKWVASGADYATHWAFQRPTKPTLPKVKNNSWLRHPIDHFVLSRLEREGLQPNDEANRERLIRRVTFDLTGLPPTPAEVAKFVADPAPDAYENLVDALLKRDSYGERMTSEWLDVARYSDSFGYQVDRGRHVWPWRDWVINAFNQNMSYRQFVIEQLAGDMLPDATDSQILATAFNRLHPQKVEGGSVPEEFRVEYVADRTHTFGTAFLGLTLECARCHDHKYDPITQKEYYQLFAYFNNIDEAGLYSYFTSSTPTPTLLLSSADRKKQIEDVNQKLAAKEAELRNFKSDPSGFEKWIAEHTGPILAAPIESNSFEDFKSGRNTSVPGAAGKGVKLTGDDALGLKTGNFTRNQPFSISLWINSPDIKKRAVVLHRSRAWTDAGSRGYQLLIEDGKLSASLIHFWPGNAIRVQTDAQLPINQWTQVGFSYDGSSRAAGLRIYVNGKPVSTTVVRDNLYKNITGGGGNNIAIGQRFRDNGFKDGLVDEIRVFDRQLTELEFSLLDGDASRESSSLKALGDISASLRDSLREIYTRHIDKQMASLKKEIKSLRDQRSKLVDGVVEIMVMKEMENRRQTFKLQRGAYDKPTNLVNAATPDVLGPADKPKSRLELARWLVSDENPLTARVTVNRYWQMIFGEGLVRTPEDFGSQGSPPTHPELLDWLAKDFVENDWNLKRLIKQMVMSATYRQDSRLTPELYRRDPENLLLARAFSFRMPAEMLRDNALFAGGLLVNKVGGSGAKPYDLALSFKPVGVDKGEGLYRRSVYTYWKRTGPSPVMMTLDASKRDVCTVKRERTATPLQSFVLLNDPQFVEASRTLAATTLESAKDPQSAVSQIFQKLTSRKPTQKEQTILMQLLDAQTDYFRDHKESMTKYLKVGRRQVDAKLDPVQVAALTSVVQTIMNFDECVMRR